MEEKDQDLTFPGYPPFALGDARVDPPALSIEIRGVRLRVEAKTMQMLLVLAREPGRVVSRQALEGEVWAGRVVTDDSVTNAIGKLRKALHDNPRSPWAIETIAKSGYRLKVEPKRLLEETVPATAHPQERAVRRSSRRRTSFVVLALGVALALSALLFWPAREQTTTDESKVASAEASVAVIPFDVLHEDPSQAYFAEGITLDLITELSRLPGLLVIAPGTVFGYRGTVADDRLIASELGVHYLIRGGVQRIGERVRINVRLLEADRGLLLWAERFDGEATGLFRIQDEVVKGIARSLPAKLALPAQPMERSGATDSIAAYDEFLRGQERYGRRTPEDNRIAAEHFERAAALDPSFARAYSGLALVWSRLAIDGWTDEPEEALEKAVTYAQKAASIDRSVPQIHFVLAQVDLFRRQHQRAAAAATTALELDPNYADAYALLAWILHYAGRPDQAEAALREALRRNPASSASYREIAGEIYFTTGRYEKAEAELRAALERNPAHMRARLWLAATLATLGNVEEASWEVQELLAVNPDFSLSRLLLAFPLKDRRQLDVLTAALAKLGLED